MFNLQGKDSEHYFKEVEYKLLEETDYELELTQGVSIAKACEKIENLRFPRYYPELSSAKTITMDWMDGEHLSEFTAHNQDREKAIKLARPCGIFICFRCTVCVRYMQMRIREIFQ